MPTLTIRVSDATHEAVRTAAFKERISINEWAKNALNEKAGKPQTKNKKLSNLKLRTK